MAMKHCPFCGEEYSDTYRDCPFCEEEEALQDGDQFRRGGRRGRRVVHGRQYSILTPTLIILILIMAGLLIYLLYGDKWTKNDEQDNTPDIPTVEDPLPVQPENPDNPQGGQAGVMPEDPETTDPPETPGVSEQPAETEYDIINKLPRGLTLSKEDFSLFNLGETATITVSGGSGSYEWVSEDDGIASVDQNGKVTAVSGGTVNILVTDGNKKGVCIVRVRATGTLTETPSSSDSGSTLQAGAAMVVNGGNGVRVRSGPSTDHTILATVPNGASIQIVESAGNGWYKITFSGVGGVTTTGYMKGDFLSNR